MGKPATQLPVKALNPLLDTHGIQHTWELLLNTHAASHGETDHGLLSTDEKMETDLLTDLSIGNIAVLYEYSLAHVNADSRKSEGQYFTPDDVASTLAGFSCSFPPGATWLDPCSGVGNLSYHLAELQSNPTDFILNHLYLVDKDPLALLIARFFFSLTLRKSGEDFAETFMEFGQRCIEADYLSLDTPAYDYAILNPPYVSTTKDERFVTAECKDYYAYFLEKVILESHGFISVTPQSFMHLSRFSSLRQLLVSNMQRVTMYSFDNMPGKVFGGVKYGTKNTNKGNSIRPCMMVAIKESTHPEWTTSPLLRWTAAERSTLFSSLPSHKAVFAPDTALFPKTGRNLIGLYKSVCEAPRALGDLVGEGEYVLHLPMTTRYYITATQKKVNRGAIRTLTFPSEENRDLAYILLNSGYFYWWWRTVDGGMNVSSAAVMSLPVLDRFTVNPSLVVELLASEDVNMVRKFNAQSWHENVKHDVSLLKKLDAHLFDADTADQFTLERRNSSVGLPS